MKVSVVYITCGVHEIQARTLEALGRHTPNNCEIIILQNGVFRQGHVENASFIHAIIGDVAHSEFKTFGGVRQGNVPAPIKQFARGCLFLSPDDLCQQAPGLTVDAGNADDFALSDPKRYALKPNHTLAV